MSRAELLRALASIAEAPTSASPAVAGVLGLGRPPDAAEHTELLTFQLHPYASVHLGPEGQLGGVARDRVAGFFRALGAVPVAEPDHLAVLLSAYAELLDLDEGEGSRPRHARAALLHEHVLPWVPRFAGRVAELGAEPFVRWARLLAEVVVAEAQDVGAAPALSAHLRSAPPLPSPHDEEADFLQALLAPVRSGLILARADLVRAAERLGLGLRVGERRYMLRALLAQDTSGVLRFLASEAIRQRADVLGADVTATFWRERLTTTAEVLGSLASTPIDVTSR